MFCPVCSADNSADARLCVKCGSPLGLRCPACGAEVLVGARFCSACGRALSSPAAAVPSPEHQSPARLAGERKQVTVLFADFSGFTAFSSRLDPEDLRENMNSIWANLDAIVAAHGGTPEKHTGDALMAVFGGWRSREEDAAQAVRAGLAMQAWLQASTSLQMRVGIHTGLVVLGPADHTLEFLVGDALNLASRLEQSAPVGGVLISRETYRHVHGLFDAQAMPPLTVRGKPEPVETYVILRAKPRGLALQIRGIEGVETEMIGREQELKRLQSVLEQATQHQRPQILTVVAEGGIGKSRLFREFQKWTDLLPQYLRLFCGRATPETTSLPFALIRDLFCARFEIQESDPAALARQKFEHGLADLSDAGTEVGACWRQELMLDIHFIGQLLGLDFSASPHLRDILGDAEQIRQRAFHGFTRLLAAMSQCPASDRSPPISAILLVVEDLHWCDNGSLDLIEHLARNCPGVPMMILCSARPDFFERRSDWCQGPSNAGRLNLEPLSLSESHALVNAILRKAAQIPPALRELVSEAAEGNPFYVEEMIKMLLDQKVIVPQGEQWQIELGRLANARVPSTLTGVLQARLDGLCPSERVVLQRASVVGRVFWDSAVNDMGSLGGQNTAPSSLIEGTLNQNDITLALEGLRRKDLIFRRGASTFAGSVEYMFKHELLRNVAYESMLKKSRRQHHARIAEWLKERSGDRIHEFAGLVATHFEQASRLAQAAEWHGRAGQLARLGYAPAIASDHFKKALQLLPQDGADPPALQKQQLEWQEGLGDTLGAQARSSEAMAACAAARDLARQLSDPAAEARAWNSMAFFHERRGDNRASVQCAAQAEALACQAAQAGRAERIRALHFKGWAFYRLGDAPAVMALGDQTLQLCTQQGDRRGTATSFKLLGVAHLQLGHYAQADRFFEQGLALFDELGDRRNTAAMFSNRGEIARACGDYQTAARLYEQALAITRQIGQRDSELIYLANLCGVRVRLQDFQQAEMDLRQVISQTLGPNSCALSEACTFLSEACLGQGKLAEAVETAQKAITLAQESESSLYLGGAWRALGRIGAKVLKSPSQSTGAKAAGPGRVEGGKPRPTGTTDKRVPKQSTGAAALSDLPIPEAAHCFAESLRVFQKINAEGEQACTLRDWGEYDLCQGHLEEGRTRLQEARAIFLQLDASFEVATTEKLLRLHGAS